MHLKKIFIKEVLEETIREYEEKIMKLPNIEIKFIDKEEFLESAMRDRLIQMQIQLGLYKNFKKEYPNFLVVYNIDKQPFSYLMNGVYYISIVYEMAKDKLKPFNKEQVKKYLKRQFAHEITHIVENQLKQKYPEYWVKLLEKTQDEGLAHEEMAEDFADKIVDNKHNQYVFNQLWSLIMSRTKKM